MEDKSLQKDHEHEYSIIASDMGGLQDHFYYICKCEKCDKVIRVKCDDVMKMMFAVDVTNMIKADMLTIRDGKIVRVCQEKPKRGFEKIAEGFWEVMKGDKN